MTPETRKAREAAAQAAAVEAKALGDLCVIPNLDHLSTDPTDLHAAALVFGRLACYCDQVARAMEHRAGGDIEAAAAFEAAADRQYKMLPPWARW
jgi:hypothetical protein